MSWITDNKGYGVWAFQAQEEKLGYFNNPFWTNEGTPRHYPCGYWRMNDAIYSTSTKTTTTHATSWDLVAPAPSLPHRWDPRATIFKFEDDDGLYGVMLGCLYKWNESNAWDLVLTTPNEIYNQSACQIGNTIYIVGKRISFPYGTHVYSWTLGDAGWSLVQSFAPSLNIKEIGVYNGALYFVSSDRCTLYDAAGTPLVTPSYMFGWGNTGWVVEVNDTLYILPTVDYGSSDASLWQYTPPAAITNPAGALPFSGAGIVYGAQSIVMGTKIYRYFSNLFGSYGLYYYDTANPGGWVECSLSGIPNIAGSACLYNYNGLLYIDVNSSLLYYDTDLDATELLFTGGSGGPGYQPNSHVVYKDYLYRVSTSGVLTRVLTTETVTTFTNALVNWTSPDNVVWPFTADEKETVVWSKLLYADGSQTSGQAPIDNTIYRYGRVATVAEPGSMTKLGYLFESWNTAEDGSGTTYYPGDTITMQNTLTLYPQWTLIMRAVYDGNGYTSGDIPTDSTEYTYGDSVTVLGPGTLAKAGYEFTGWNLQSNGGGDEFSAGDTTTIVTTLVFYAQWAAITKTLTYVTNNSFVTGTPPDAVSCVKGSIITVSDQGGLVSDNYWHYDFLGWGLQARGSTIDYTAGSPLTVTEDTILYGKWKQYYTVTYYSNLDELGTGEAPVDSTHYYAGDTITVLNKGTLDNYRRNFLRWDRGWGGGAFPYETDPGDTIRVVASSMLGDVHLKAHWDVVKNEVVYLDTDSTSGSPPTDAVEYNTGDTVTVLGSGTLARTDHTFLGWSGAVYDKPNNYLSAIYSGFKQGDTFKFQSSSVRLAPVWEYNWSFPYVAGVEPAAWYVGFHVTVAKQLAVVNITEGTAVNITVNWGDGTTETFTSTGEKYHLYTTAGYYSAQISGSITNGCISLFATGRTVRVAATGVIGGITGLTHFTQTFASCLELYSVPADLFRFYPAVTDNAFYYTFYNSPLIEIPAGLFAYNVLAAENAFTGTFAECSRISTIPSGLFDTNTAVSVCAFSSTFYRCNSLTSVPSGLFDNNVLASTDAFNQTFMDCIALESVPTLLFRENVATSGNSFKRTFCNCIRLALNDTIFCDSGEEATRFAGAVPKQSFEECFRIVGQLPSYISYRFIGTQSSAVPLWTYTFNVTPDFSACFSTPSESRDARFTNWNAIPLGWGRGRQFRYDYTGSVVASSNGQLLPPNIWLSLTDSVTVSIQSVPLGGEVLWTMNGVKIPDINDISITWDAEGHDFWVNVLVGYGVKFS